MPQDANEGHTQNSVKAKTSSFLDSFVYIVAVAEPLGNLPQIIKIYGSQQAAGVSVTSWSLYAFFAITWLLYGLRVKQAPMVVAGILFFITDAIVIIGALIYGSEI